MRIDPKKIRAALKHLRTADPVMRDVIRRVGSFRLKLKRDRFGTLVRSIISQQISVAAARSIQNRLWQAAATEKPTAQILVRLSDADLRSAGLSPQKVRYLRDLCEYVLDKRLELGQIGRKSDERVIDELVQVKGIGRWTAQMFLIFSLGRLDVFPHDDLGIRTNIRNLYRLSELPDKATSHRIAAPWRPYASVACWYCWRNGDVGDDWN
jgi:DNA-3-methyladenine glycosylase II